MFSGKLQLASSKTQLNMWHYVNRISSFEEYFAYVDVWGWSAVLASSLVDGHPLRWTMYGLWKKYEFFNVHGIDKKVFFNFADRLEQSYGKASDWGSY